MDDKRSVRIVTTGRILDGFDRAKVEADLARLALQDAATVQRLLAAVPHVVKHNVDAAIADRYVRRLRAIGVECTTEPEHLDLEPQPLAQSPASVIPTPSSAVAAPVKGTQFAQPIRSGKSPKKPDSFWRGFWGGLGVLFLGLFVFLALFNDDRPFPIFAPAGKTSRPSKPQQAVSIPEKTKEQQIADALSSIKRYDAKDYFSRRNRYEDLVALDPDNKEYKQQLDKYQKLYAANIASPSANPSKADIRILRDFDTRVHELWAENDRAYSAYRKEMSESLLDLSTMVAAAVQWDTALAAVEGKLTKLDFPEPDSPALKTALEDVLRNYREAIGHERAAAQDTISMLARQAGNPEDIRQEITKLNVATGKSVLALLKAYDQLGIKPPPPR